MNLFDRICAVFAFALGILFVLVGLVGLFVGVSAWFTLPPVLGILPAFAGWGIVRAIYFAWRVSKPSERGLRVP